LLLGLGLAGCTGGTETGNPSLTGELSYSGVSSAPTDIGVRQGGAVATVHNAWFALDEVTISSAGDCGVQGNASFSVRALGIGDHAAGIHNATDFEAPAGAFCSVVLPFLPVAADDTTAPAELRGHGVVVAGELADGTPFLLESDQAPLVELRGPDNGFELSSQAPNVLLAFDFATWLEDADWATASVDSDRILVSERSNPELLQKFEARLAAGVALYRDRDGDGVLDSRPVLLASAP
jgi:hypothetical protein